MPDYNAPEGSLGVFEVTARWETPTIEHFEPLSDRFREECAHFVGILEAQT